MKDFLIRIVLSTVIYFIPIIPMWLVEPIKKGSDSVYSFWGEVYMYGFVIFLFCCWYKVASNLVDKFLGEDEIL